MGSTYLLVLIVMVSNTWMSAMSQYDPGSHKGTSPSIEEVFVGRCWDYDLTRYKGLLPRVSADCNDVWKTFVNAFAYKDPCHVRMEDYDAFLKLATQDLPFDKVMFWSGVYSLAHRLSESASRYVTLEDILIGYLANNITWCGQTEEPGINYELCPSWFDCPLEASESFWAAASKLFASKASGVVTVMLDGSNPNKPAYRPNSIFGKYELPNMGKHVSQVNVIVTHALDKPKMEVCGYGSLLVLEKDVSDAGLTFTCIDDPSDVLHILCADDPMNRECVFATRHMTSTLEIPENFNYYNGMPDMFSPDIGPVN